MAVHRAATRTKLTDRVTAAADYLRSALVHSRSFPDAVSAAEAAIARLMEIGDQVNGIGGGPR